MSTVEASRLIEVATFVDHWIFKEVEASSYPSLQTVVLRHCPFCPSTAPTNLSLLLEENLYTITCNVCNCLGPEDKDLLTALKLWNGQG